jgi:hypothetical protein
MKELTIDGINNKVLSYEELEDSCFINFQTSPSVSLKIQVNSKKGYDGYADYYFERILFTLKKYKFEVSDVNWIMFLFNNKEHLNKISGIPDMYLFFVEHPNLMVALEKYGINSKQVKVIVKLYRD